MADYMLDMLKIQYTFTVTTTGRNLLKKEISNYEEDRLSSRFAALYDTIKQMKKNG